jgi:hypothetical protein
MATIDIVVPCYNYGRFLPDCIGALLSQSFKNLRVLIIDNGSTDDSLKIARDLAATDPRVEVRAIPKNIGPQNCYNVGVDWASADYFFLIDADDVLAPGALDRAIQLLETNPHVAMTYGRELRVEFAAGEALRPDDDMLRGDWEIVTGRRFLENQIGDAMCTVGASGVIRRTSAQKAAGHYRPELPFADDWELWMRIALFGDVASTNAVQSIRRLHPAAQSTVYDRNPIGDFSEREATFACFFTREGATLPDAASLMRQVRHNLAAQAYWSGISNIVRGHPRQGWKLLMFALSRRPAIAVVPPVRQLLRMRSPLLRLRDVIVEAVTGKPQGFWLRDRARLLADLNRKPAPQPHPVKPGR